MKSVSFAAEKLIRNWFLTESPYAPAHFPATEQLAEAMWLIHVLLPDQSTWKLAHDPPALLPEQMFQTAGLEDTTSIDLSQHVEDPPRRVHMSKPLYVYVL